MRTFSLYLNDSHNKSFGIFCWHDDFVLEWEGLLAIGGVLVEDWLSTELGVLAVEVGETGKFVEVGWRRVLVEVGWLVERGVGGGGAGISIWK